MYIKNVKCNSEFCGGKKTDYLHITRSICVCTKCGTRLVVKGAANKEKKS